MSNARIERVFEEASQALEQFRANADNLNCIAQAAECMVQSLRAGGKLISCGNGGSMCDAMHFAEELSGRFRNDRPALAALSISDPSHISCVANDFGYDYVFSRYIEAVGKAGDVLLAISTSGNSRNVVKAAEVARTMGIAVVALTGKDGGQLAALADVEIRAPHSTYADRAQEIHIKVIHALIDQIEHGIYAGRK
jgi:D-sedoheptulose 7-phosphate isomerase